MINIQHTKLETNGGFTMCLLGISMARIWPKFKKNHQTFRYTLFNPHAQRNSQYHKLGGKTDTVLPDKIQQQTVE
jgi:hypothetical protein